MTELLTRKAVRHAILRARNARVVADERDARMPLALHMHPNTLTELLVDSDPSERDTLDFEGLQIIGIPIQTDPRLEPGVFRLQWPVKKEAPRG